MKLLDWIRPKSLARSRRRWRNWYRCERDHDSIVGFKHAGEEFAGANIYPSKDLAETEAIATAAWMEELSKMGGDTNPWAWLGAREEGPDA